MPRRSTKWVSVVAYDPGNTTGWSVVEVNAEQLIARTPLKHIIGHSANGEIVGSEQKQNDELLDLIDAWETSAVVGEDFIIRQFNQADHFLSPVRINAVVANHLYSRRADQRRTLFLQQPALAKSTITDHTLREFKMYHQSSPHARDATRHALTFLRRVAADERMLREAWPFLNSAAA